MTKVIFLIHPTGDLFAYFPNEKYDAHSNLKVSYAHIGQHSACHPDYAKESTLATEDEYSELKAELEQVGYKLKVLTTLK